MLSPRCRCSGAQLQGTAPGARPPPVRPLPSILGAVSTSLTRVPARTDTGSRATLWALRPSPLASPLSPPPHYLALKPASQRRHSTEEPLLTESNPRNVRLQQTLSVQVPRPSCSSDPHRRDISPSGFPHSVGALVRRLHLHFPGAAVGCRALLRGRLASVCCHDCSTAGTSCCASGGVLAVSACPLWCAG